MFSFFLLFCQIVFARGKPGKADKIYNNRRVVFNLKIPRANLKNWHLIKGEKNILTTGILTILTQKITGSQRRSEALQSA